MISRDRLHRRGDNLPESDTLHAECVLQAQNENCWSTALLSQDASQGDGAETPEEASAVTEALRNVRVEIDLRGHLGRSWYHSYLA